MNLALAQRQLALAGIALLAAILALGLRSVGERSSGPNLPEAIPTPDGGWYRALAAAHGPSFERRHLDKACGHVVGPASLGVAHPVLPCNAKLYIRYGGREALTQVIARGPYTPGSEFELTPALAQKLGMRGTEVVRWRYAR